MEGPQLIATILGLTNLIPGVLLAFFHKPMGTKMSSVGKKLNLDKIVSRKLYEEKTSQKIMLIVGIWLIMFGIIAFFLFPRMILTNS